MRKSPKSLIAFVFAIAMLVSAISIHAQAPTPIRQWQDSDGTFAININTGSWSIASPHGNFSGSSIIEDMGNYLVFSGSGSAGVDGLMFLGGKVESGTVDVQCNCGSGGSFTISGTCF